jgi:hypothetical protein
VDEQLEAAKETERKKRIAADVALVRLEAQLLERLVPLNKLPGRAPARLLLQAATLRKTAHEELVLAKLAFLFGDTSIGEAALGRARDADASLKNDTDVILARARRERVPRGGYFRYRGVWLSLAARDHCRALDDALEALAAVRIEGLVLPVAPDPARPNRDAFEKLGTGVGENRMREAVATIRATLGEDYATVRSWLRSYAANPKLRKKLLDKREALRGVQREAVTLIHRYSKLEQGRVDAYRKQLCEMYADFHRDVERDFAALDRLDPDQAWKLQERLRRREGAIAAVDRFFAVARIKRLDAGVVRPARGSTVTTVHLLPGRRTSGLEDTLWLLVKHKCDQTLDIFHRAAEILRHRKRLTPWERLVIETIVADAIDSYNAKAATSLDAVEREFVRILNSYRRTLGLRPFELEERLNVSAKKHSQEMVDLGYFGHGSPVPRNRTPSDRVRLEGYNGGVSENCLAGSGTGRGAFEGWYHSPGHHRNMIGGGPHLGVGRAATTMWTMVAGGHDLTWRAIHRDRAPAEHRIESARAAIVAEVPRILPHLANVTFPIARDRRRRGHAAFPTLLGILIGADIGTTWRPLQIAAVAAAIEAMRTSDRLEIRQAAFDLVAPHLQRAFGFDPTAHDAKLAKVVADVRKHWEDVAQWRFRAASDARPPAPRRMAGRSGDGPSLNAAQRMLTRRERLQLARKYGGGARTEQAVERGLAFLASIQDDDGAWRARSFPLKLPKVEGRAGSGNADWEIAMTGLALLSFSSAGHTTKAGQYAEVVAKGARFLARQLVDYGRFETTASHYVYNHALGTQALCEVYAYSADPRLGTAAQLAVDFLAYAQHPESGGWRYEANQFGDMSVTGWVILALNSAFKAELDVSGFRGAMRFVDRMTQSPYYQVGYQNRYDAGTHGNRLTAVAMTSRLFLGAKQNDSRLVLPAHRMMEDLPAGNRIDFYYWYYATLALFQMGDPFWKKWNDALIPALLDEQDVKSTQGLRGSWAPRGPFADYGGRIYQTTLAILMLTTYYRYDRAPKIRLHPFTGDIEKAVRPFLAAIRDDKDNHRQRIAMRKVVDTFGASLVGPVIRIIKDEKADLEYRRRLATLLDEVAEKRHAAMLSELLALDDHSIVTSALNALVESSSRGSVPALLYGLTNRHRNVRAFCARQLGRLGDATAIAGIDKRLGVERDRWVKGELQKALHQLTKRSRLTELLALALPKDVEGYLSIVDGLVPLERDGLVEFVFALERANPRLHKRALAAIDKHRAAAGVPLLLILMESPSLDARTRATRLVQAITRKSFGFDPKEALDIRRAALNRWQLWWKRAAPGFVEPR